MCRPPRHTEGACHLPAIRRVFVTGRFATFDRCNMTKLGKILVLVNLAFSLGLMIWGIFYMIRYWSSY